MNTFQTNDLYYNTENPKYSKSIESNPRNQELVSNARMNFNPPSQETQVSCLDKIAKSKLYHPDSTEKNLRIDHLIKSLVFQFRYDWKKISKRIKNLEAVEIQPKILQLRYKMIKESRTVVQVQTKFKKKEDDLLFKKVRLHGLDWNKIVAYFPKRNTISIRNRYYYLAKKTDYLVEKRKMGVKASTHSYQKNYNTLELNTLIKDIILEDSPYCLEIISKMMKEPKTNEDKIN